MEVQTIKATNPINGSLAVNRKERLRVAAYCRVSTDDDEQLKSYDSMVTYYTDYIQKNSDWDFAGVYADEATTGTMVNKRYKFQELIGDCLNGKIDMVIAKSLSRFARNTYDTLKYVRLLKEKGIAIYFEVEKINTLKDGEFLMTILSSVAQQEVENISAYVKKGLKMKMKRGELVGFQGCLGYDYDSQTKSLSINEEGAEVVRYIFERYVSGAGSSIIARELNERNITTIRGNSWTSSTVMGIINNEKYKGDILMGKTFTVSPISKRRLENKGEEDKYYISNHHTPIISTEIFDKAQEIRNKRNGNRNFATPGFREKYSRQFSFSSMLECGYCGGHASRRRWHSGSEYAKIIWQCSVATKKGKRFCPDSKGIPEEIIEQAFIASYKLMYNDNKEIFNEFLNKVEKALGDESFKDKLNKCNRKISELKNKRKKLLEKYLEDNISAELFEETDAEYNNKLIELTKEAEIYEMQLDEESSLKGRIIEFRKALSHNQIIKSFDRAVFESIVEKVIVGGYDDEGNKDPYKITFIYKNGFTDSINDSKNQFVELLEDKNVNLQMYSNSSDEADDWCSDNSVNTCGDGSFAFTGLRK